MAITMTMPLSSATSATTTPSSLPENELSCPNCGLSLPSPASDPHIALLQAQRQIEDLQAQVRLLNQKASAAADRWADYEDELSRLRAASTSTNSTTATTSTKTNNNNSSSNSSSIGNGNGNGINNNNNNNNNRPHTPDPSVATNSPRSSFLGAGASRISQLLSPRKSPSASSPSPTPPPTTTASTSTNTSNTATTATALQQQQQRGSLSSVPESPALLPPDETRKLMKALTHERRLRAAAEEKLEATNREVEDLSASLFEQANNMVADERRARAALEEQLDRLRRRDEEKKDRIGRLEGAVMRIERVRVMLEDKEVGIEDSEGGEDDGDEGRKGAILDKEGMGVGGENEGKGEEMELREDREDEGKAQRLTRDDEGNMRDEREDEQGKNRSSINGCSDKHAEQAEKAGHAEG